jgi:hypothetical protein
MRVNADPQEVLTGIIPTAQVDRSWPKDVGDVWGAFHQGFANINTYAAVELVAQRRRLRVYRVTAWEGLSTAIFNPTNNRGLHLFTPLQTYDPTVLNRTLQFPWLQTGYLPGQAGYLGEAFTLGGANVALQVVTVNGVNYTAIGPAFIHGGSTALASSSRDHEHVLWDSQDPPLLVQPFTSLCVQSWAPAGANNYHVSASFIYSEEVEED